MNRREMISVAIGGLGAAVLPPSPKPQQPLVTAVRCRKQNDWLWIVELEHGDATAPLVVPTWNPSWCAGLIGKPIVQAYFFALYMGRQR